MNRNTHEEIKRTIITLCDFVNDVATKKAATPAELEAMAKVADTILTFASDSSLVKNFS
jgi:hypothetical protein